MSFLNPVNEPVMRFSSTDAGAPQINYAQRVPGDVKTVIKACLDTGYGDKAGAGWITVNEVDHVAEFVSPSVAMSDYRLGIDDTSATATTWYYQYQDARVNPSKNSLNKKHNTINKTSAKNGWQLLVTEQGFYFIEILNSSLIDTLFARVTYFGRIKSALIEGVNNNIAFFSIGSNSHALVASDFFSSSNISDKHYQVGSYNTAIKFGAANLESFTRSYTLATDTTASAELISPLYLYNTGYFVGQQPAMLLKETNLDANRYGVYDTTIESRPVLSACLAWDINDIDLFKKSAKSILIYLDTWEY